MKYNLDKLRALNPLSAELDRYGITADRKGFARCPFHNEKTASFRVYPDDTFHCFGCGAHGDVITFVMKMQNLTFNAACEQLDGDISYSEQRRINKIKRERENEALQRVSAADKYFSALDEYEANEAVIRNLRPASNDAQPLFLWLLALNMRSKLEYALDLAEKDYMKGGCF